MHNYNVLEKRPELKALLEEVKERTTILIGNKLKQIILFGSFARGEEKQGSDIDIMLLIDEGREEIEKYGEDILDIMTDLSLKYDVVLSILEVSVQDYNKYKEFIPFYENVSYEGVEIYG